MEKIILALVLILFTTPAWASVAISVTDIGDGKAIFESVLDYITKKF